MVDRTDGGWDFVGEVADVIEGQLQRDVHGVLRASKTPLTPTAIGQRLGKPANAVQKVLPKLVERNVVVTSGDGTYEHIDNAIKRRHS